MGLTDLLKRAANRDLTSRGVTIQWQTQGNITEDDARRLYEVLAIAGQPKTPTQQAREAELRARQALATRRWTDKDWIVANFATHTQCPWPVIPKGHPYAGECGLRVFIKISDDPADNDPPPGAILWSKLSTASATAAGLTAADKYLWVPLKFWMWLSDALSFEKKVLLGKTTAIMEHTLTHDDADIHPDVVWIVPMKAADRKFYYAVLPTVGIHRTIDPTKGTRGIFAPIQATPGDNVVWETVDRVIDAGITSWGQFAPGRVGANELFAIKLEFVNFLRDLADRFVMEDFGRQIRRGAFDRSSVEKAIGNGLFAHRPNADRIRLENLWLKMADTVDLRRAVRASLAFRSYVASNAGSAISKGVGEGWGDPQREANRRVEIAWLCSRYGVKARAARLSAISKDFADEMEELAEKAYLDGDASLAEVRDIAGGNLKFPIPGDTVDADKDFYDRWLIGFEDELDWLAGSSYPS